jgi:conserved oligomeric Golgi complex subunit 3
MTERHLDGLIDDTNAALKLLTSLSNSFQAVQSQTTSFQSQCEDLLTEQRRLQKLGDEVGTDLHFYAYLDNVTRRLNAPGAGRLVDDSEFGEIFRNLNSCIAFMTKHVRGLSRERLPSLEAEVLIAHRHHTVTLSHTWQDIKHYSRRHCIF